MISDWWTRIRRIEGICTDLFFAVAMFFVSLRIKRIVRIVRIVRIHVILIFSTDYTDLHRLIAIAIVWNGDCADFNFGFIVVCVLFLKSIFRLLRHWKNDDAKKYQIYCLCISDLVVCVWYKGQTRMWKKWGFRKLRKIKINQENQENQGESRRRRRRRKRLRQRQRRRERGSWQLTVDSW